MSTVVMSACWQLQMSPTQKAVLISLADNANDQGHCWPSIDTICERTCLGRTAVIDAIKELETAGHVSADRSNGRRTSYVIHPNQSASRTGERAQTSPAGVPVSDANQSATRTGPPNKPVRQTDQTSPPDGLNQSARRTLTVKNHQEPSKARRRALAVRPDSVPENVWSDFVAHRKAKRAPLTDTALAGIQAEADKAGVSLAEALTICCRQGWQGFNADWLDRRSKPSGGSEPWRGAI